MFAWLLGGIIGAANRSGGMAALGPLVVGYIKDSFLSQLITFFFGFLIFMVTCPFSPISHGPSASTMVKVEPSGAPAAIDASDL